MNSSFAASKLIFAMVAVALMVVSCQKKLPIKSTIIKGTADSSVNYLIAFDDTIDVVGGVFLDTLELEESTYQYVQLEGWKWPRLMFFDVNSTYNLDFRGDKAIDVDDEVNGFLLNVDSILVSYTARWDMNEDSFSRTFSSEMAVNFKIIEDYFLNTEVSSGQVGELKLIEQMKRGHRTANFISYQERQGVSVDRGIYDFVKGMNLNNERLVHQVNNRNFQYYYILDKLDENLEAKEYPFAAIDTVNKYVGVNDIREMLITSVVKSSLFDDEVNHDSLFDIFTQNISKVDSNNIVFLTYKQLEKLKPGKVAPSFGQLENLEGDTVTLNDLSDQNLLITVWGTWCPYCREELPYLKSLKEEFGNNFTSVGLSLDKDKEKWRSYLESNDWEGVHLIDPIKKSAFRQNYVVGGTNKYFLIDKEGKILMNGTMRPSSGDLKDLLKKLD